MIRIRPDRLWQFFCDHIFRLKYEEYVLAENPDNGMVLSLMATQEYEPAISVERDGNPIAFYIVDEENLEKTVASICEAFFEEPEEDDTVEEKQEDAEPETEDVDISDLEIEERENEIKMAFRDFLYVAIEDRDAAFKDNIDDLLNDTLSLISSYGHSVYRPMIVEYCDGTEELLLYPYAEEQK